ncbi:calcium-binding protein [Croceicoccus naphthovorans]|uniref:Calcium-binding protein n=1 Tax=Croceicoccus naphthovorans TaxID=1348774 RepID=A0A0G3XLS1_9SPHN|nr:calcium-binding protein [Croceicoccus naphthovorans]
MLGSIAAAPALAHGGGVDASGCHTNRSTGEYHCHGSRSAPAPAPKRDAPIGAFYRNCAEAHAAGVTPLRRGQPGYRPALDRDGDGVACEK